MILGLAVLTGCDSTRAVGTAANAARGDKRTAITAGMTGASVATATMTSNRRSESAQRQPASLAQRPTVEGMRTRRPTENSQQTPTVSAPASEPKEIAAKPQPKPVSIAEISDDKEFFAALKKNGKTTDKKILERALKMKDQKLLAEFIGLYPDQATKLAEMSSVDFQIKDPTLAAAIVDNAQNPYLLRFAWHQFFPCMKLLDDKDRAKHLARAKENREKAAKEGVLLFDKFYLGMPVIDYVILALEDNHTWTKSEDAYEVWNDWLKYRADMETNISGKDWKTAWKIKDLSFDAKSRYKYFKVKGTVEGLFEFVKKYMDKSAQRTDITISGNWWLFTDEEHELKVGMNDENGILNIHGM